MSNTIGRAMVAFHWAEKRYEMKLQFGDQFNKPKLLTPNHYPHCTWTENGGTSLELIAAATMRR